MSHSDPTVIRETTQNINPDLNNFSPDIAERAKMRARKATKRASQYADEEVIDITDDELAATPTRKLKKRVNLRPAKRATPVGNNLQLNSDPVTTPLPSSSPLLPLSDPFPESTLINSTPPRPHPPVEVAASGSPSQESPIQPRKRKRTVHLHSPIDNLSEPNCPPALPARVTTPRSNSLPPSEGVVDGVDLGQNLNPNKEGSEDEYDGTIMPKKHKSAEKGSGSAAARPESSRVSKSKKPTVMIVIMSPRKRKTESKQAKAKKKDGRNPERNDTESIKDRPPSSANPAEQAHRSVDDNDVHASLRQRSDSDDELVLAPKRQPSSKVKRRKGKQRTREPHSADSDALSEVNPSSEQVATGEEEKEQRRDDEHHTESTYTRTNEDHKTRSCAAEPESPAPLQVGLISISMISVTDPTEEIEA